MLAVGLALLLQFVLVPLSGGDPDRIPFMMFFAAVMVAAWVGGLWPGLSATALSALLASYFFLFPQYSLHFASSAQALRLAVFVLEGALISALVEMMHTARRRAEANALEVKKSEAELRVRVRQQHAIAKLGQRALADTGLAALMDEAVTLVAEVLDLEYCKVLELLPDGRDLLLRAGVGWEEGLVGRATIGAGLDSQAGYTLRSDRPVIVEDLRTETRFDGPPLLCEHGVVSGMSVIIGSSERPFGVLCVHTKERRTFTEDDVTFLQVVANVLAAAVEHERAEETQRFLAEAGEELSSSLDYYATLSRVARLAVPTLADWCAVDIPGDNGSVERLAVIHQDPEKVAWAHKLHERYPPDLEAPAGLPNVLRTGRSEFYPEITDGMLKAAARDEEHLRLIRELGFTSAMVVPLIVAGKTVGVITLVRSESGRRYTRADLRLAEDLARRAALTVDNARLYEEAKREIAERRRAEEGLRRSEERFRLLVQNSSDVISVFDARGVVRYRSASMERVLGHVPGDSIGMKVFESWLVHPDDLAHKRDFFNEVRAKPSANVTGEFRMRHADGSWRYVEAVGKNLLDDPVVRGIITNYRDVTERKLNEDKIRQLNKVLEQRMEALKQSEKLYRTVVEQAGENIFIIDLGTKQVLEANAATRHSLGYAPEEFERMTLYDIVAHDRESINDNIRHIVEQKRYFLGERKYRRSDGSLVDVEVNASVIPYGGKEAMCVVAHDVSERKQAEQELRRSLSVLVAHREAGAVLGSTLESDEIVTRLLEIIRGVAALTTVVISRWDEDGDLHVWRSAGLEALWPRVRFTPQAEEARQAALEHQEQRLLVLRRSGFADTSMVALYLPLKVKDRVVGILEAYGSEALAQNDTREVLITLTNQAVSALENAQLYEELGDREHTLQDLVGKLMRAQEEERQRVAYEVHDGLAQVASAAHQHLQAFARRYPPGAERGRRDLERILRLVRGTVSDARRIIANLRPTVLDDLGLAAAISLEVERLHDEGYQVDYEEDLGEGRLPDAVEIALFRIAQEALTNIRKHARTRRIRMELRRRGQEVDLEVTDYGRGFDPTAQPLESGPGERVGLVGMRERVSALGGTLEIHSRAGAGTSVAATVSLSRAGQ